jgi:ABC-type multidrug transport system ATPase subunit
MVFGACIERPPSVLLIDEPELNLHASLQQDFVLRLAKYAQHGIVFGTHSMGLARSVADRILSVRPTARGSEVQDFRSGGKGYAEFLGELGYTAFTEIGCEQILMVEGVTEVRVIQQWLRLYRKEHKIVVLHLGGSNLITSGKALELSEIARITPKVAVLIDSERKAEDEPLDSERDAFVKDCKALGFTVHVTKRRATENYLTKRALQEEKGEKYEALGPYELLKKAPQPWGKAENWRIAHHMTRDELDATDVGAFLRDLSPVD